jgi:hypothetical protein
MFNVIKLKKKPINYSSSNWSSYVNVKSNKDIPMIPGGGVFVHDNNDIN